MFLIFKITAKRLFIATAMLIIALLIFDAVRTFNQNEIVCSSDSERVQYLKGQGIEVDPTPLWVKDTVISKSSSHGWAEYEKLLSKAGFSLKNYYGERVRVYCYSIKDEGGDSSVRLLCKGNKIIGFETA